MLQRTPKAKALWLALAASWAGATLWVLTNGVTVLRADLASAPEVKKVLACASESASWDDRQWLAINDALILSAVISPRDPIRHDLLASYYTCAGVADWGDPAKRYVHFLGARQSLYSSLWLRPDHAPAVAALALASFAVGEPPSTVAAHWARALELAPREETVTLAMLDLVVLSWSQASPKMQDWARQQVAQMSQPRRLQWIQRAETLGLKGVFS